MLDYCVHRATYADHFDSLVNSLIELCRRIANDHPAPGLAKLIKRKA